MVAPGEAHGFIGLPCHATILADFFARASIEDLQTGCLARVELPEIDTGE